MWGVPIPYWQQFHINRALAEVIFAILGSRLLFRFVSINSLIYIKKHTHKPAFTCQGWCWLVLWGMAMSKIAQKRKINLFVTKRNRSHPVTLQGSLIFISLEGINQCLKIWKKPINALRFAAKIILTTEGNFLRVSLFIIIIIVSFIHKKN